MFQKLSEQITACYERAAEARRQADMAADPELRADHLNMEKRWLALARSYQFTESLSTLSDTPTKSG
jgi:hypothetical protein